MLRALALASLLVTAPYGLVPQELVVLHIRVTVTDANQRPMPVARHALLVSQNPASAVPRRIVTSAEGTADIRLAPGNYTVESDRAVNVAGKAYEWAKIIDVVAGGGTTLDLTAANATVGTADASETAAAAPPEAPRTSVLTTWQASVVTLWTPHAYAPGFVVDDRGLIATSHRAVVDATAIEVQTSSTIKVAATVVASDPSRDIAVLWIDPTAVAGLRPVPLACAGASTLPVTEGQDVFTIEVSLRGQKSLASAEVNRIGTQALLADFALLLDIGGGPVFAADGTPIGMTMSANDDERGARADVRVTPASDVCSVVQAGAAKMAGTALPSAARLPVESQRPLPVTALRAAAARRPFSITPYQVSSSDFDIAFITPVLMYSAPVQEGRTGGPDNRAGVRAVTEFAEWSDYVAGAPPVLLVRVTPRFVEGFWTKVARGAASTQGMMIPAIKRLKPGFARLRVLCGTTELTPIHPFKITQTISDTEAIDEGLHVFDPDAIGPHCGSVSLVLSSAKDPDNRDTKVVDPAVIKQIWQDFAPYRER